MKLLNELKAMEKFVIVSKEGRLINPKVLKCKLTTDESYKRILLWSVDELDQAVDVVDYLSEYYEQVYLVPCENIGVKVC